jgi:hypothetical protein
MQLQSLFITPVMMTEVKGHGHLIDRLYEIKAKDEKGMPRSNVGGWHSNDKLYKDEEFKSTVGDILYKAKECFGHLDVQEKYVPEMTGLWGMINPPGSRNNVHTHPYNYLSGQAEVLSPPKIKEASIHLAHSVTWEPKENSLIFFPSWLQHEVQYNNSKEDRVILSFNINWRENADN